MLPIGLGLFVMSDLPQLNASRAARDQLATPAFDAAWFQPHATMALDVVLFGKVGSLLQAASSMYDEAGYGSEQLLAGARQSFKYHVLEPNPNVRVRFFAHSWSPALASIINRLWEPVASAHEAAVESNPAKSALLSIRRGLELTHQYGRARGLANAELTLLMRYDVAFRAPLRWHEVPKGQLWVQGACWDMPVLQNEGNREVSYAYASDSPAGSAAARACPKGTTPYIAEDTLISRYQYGKNPPHPEGNVNYFLPDWLIAAPTATIQTFMHITSKQSKYDAALRELGIHLQWLHFYFALHVHDAMRVTEGVRPMTAGLRLMRKLDEPWPCETDISVKHLLHPQSPLLYRAMAHVCGARRGTVVCASSDPWACPACHGCAHTPGNVTFYGCSCKGGRNSDALAAAARMAPSRPHWASLGSGVAQPGHCGITKDGDIGDCLEGHQGSFSPLRRVSTPAALLQRCRKKCLACHRCRFISTNFEFRDCSWYSSCHQLHAMPGHMSERVISTRAS